MTWANGQGTVGTLILKYRDEMRGETQPGKRKMVLSLPDGQ